MLVRLGKTLLLLLVAAFVLLEIRAAARRALDGYFRGDTLLCPELRGLPLEEARRQVGDRLRLEIARQTYDPKVQKGIVIAQDPPPDIRVRKGKTIFLRVSRGADLQEVPDLSGRELRKASSRLRNAGLQVGALCFIRDPSARNGTVRLQSPQAGSKLGRSGKVDLLLVSNPGEKGGFLPRVEGLPRSEAWSALKAAGLARVNQLEVIRDDLPAGIVTAQEPPGGSLFDETTVPVLSISIASGGAAPRKLLEQTFQVPPGLSARTLVVVATDQAGRRVVHRSRHLPGDRVAFPVEATGEVRLEYYLDDFLVLEETY